jgi:hypothetical protein
MAQIQSMITTLHPPSRALTRHLRIGKKFPALTRRLASSPYRKKNPREKHRNSVLAEKRVGLPGRGGREPRRASRPWRTKPPYRTKPPPRDRKYRGVRQRP